MSFHSTGKTEESQNAGSVLTVFKARGETLADLVLRIRGEQGLPDTLPITYAGRLDPMAEGVVLLLTGEACKKRDEYLSRNKTYSFDILFGVSTDTHDVLGKIMETKDVIEVSTEALQKVLNMVKTQTVFEYPPFSSKTIDGVPLFALAKEGMLPEELPKKLGVIHELELQEIYSVAASELVETIVTDIKKVNGAFRQEEIIEGWNAYAASHLKDSFILARCMATVSSGVYIRSIAHEVGKKLSVPTLAYRIERTSIDI